MRGSERNLCLPFKLNPSKNSKHWIDSSPLFWGCVSSSKHISSPFPFPQLLITLLPPLLDTIPFYSQPPPPSVWSVATEIYSVSIWSLCGLCLVSMWFPLKQIPCVINCCCNIFCLHMASECIKPPSGRMDKKMAVSRSEITLPPTLSSSRFTQWKPGYHHSKSSWIFPSNQHHTLHWEIPVWMWGGEARSTVRTLSNYY